MGDEEKKKLDRALALSEENNRILKTLLRNMRWGRLFRIAYWLVIIAASIGAFYYIQPYLNQALKSYNSIETSVKSFNSYLSK
jgi:hypothetical protein